MNTRTCARGGPSFWRDRSRVARVVAGKEGYEVGASFIHMTRLDRRRLRAHLTARQASDEPGESLLPAGDPNEAVGAGPRLQTDR